MRSSPKIIVAGFRNDQGMLVLVDDQGQEYADLWPVRMFPITDPDGWLSICDRQTKEQFCIESMDRLPASLRPLIQEELNRTMFTPVITRIERSVPLGDQVRLMVLTDRGEAEFTVETEDIYRLSGNRILLKDLNGIRYLIPDWQKLSAHSRRILDLYL